MYFKQEFLQQYQAGHDNCGITSYNLDQRSGRLELFMPPHSLQITLHPISPVITFYLALHSYIPSAVNTSQNYESVKLLYETQGLRAMSIMNVGLKNFCTSMFVYCVYLATCRLLTDIKFQRVWVIVSLKISI